MLERVSLKAEKTYESTGSRIAGGAWGVLQRFSDDLESDAVSEWVILGQCATKKKEDQRMRCPV